ncbi:hypothetical protein [Amycolatopsis sp. NPDC051061]|uniref:hypothetical protein n=1 Tax=Amycolatopsis sp. NPDC051061 TaxID=3155042 RepID=UPI0034405883
MNRSIVRRAAVYAAALATASALTGVFAAPAGAEEPTSAAPSTSEEAPSSSAQPASGAPESKPAAAQPQDDPVPQPDLAVSFDFKPSYPTNEDVHFSIKITNTRSVPVEGLQITQFFFNPDDLVVPFLDGWGPLSQKPGVTLQPGQTFERAVVGQIQDISQDHAKVRGFVFDKDGHGVAPSFDETVHLATKTGHASGVVYGDRNGDGRLDRGEELKGTTVTLQHRNLTYKATSDESGALDFGEVPAGEYVIGGEVIDGWLFPFETVQVGSDTKLVVRGAPPLDGALKASMAFTQDTYQTGDLAHVTVTLANSGPIPLTGIVAECNQVGNDYILSGRGPGWGDLAAGGVTIAPGQTRTVDVSETVPQAALNRGYVMAACDFGYRGVDLDNRVRASDQAAVPGAKATVTGDVAVRGEKHGVAGVKVVLVSDQHCPVTGEQTTDVNGHFEFHDVVPGPEYRLFFLPPKGWKIKYDNPTSINVFGPADHPNQVVIDAEQGDAPLPTVPANPADCTAAAPTSTTGAAGGTGGGESGSGLASTGVDALGLGALALIALALGGGLVIGARRRRNAA